MSNTIKLDDEFKRLGFEEDGKSDIWIRQIESSQKVDYIKCYYYDHSYSTCNNWLTIFHVQNGNQHLKYNGYIKYHHDLEMLIDRLFIIEDRTSGYLETN